MGRGAHFPAIWPKTALLSFDRFCFSGSYYALECERATKTRPACALDAGFGASWAWLIDRTLLLHAPKAC